MRLTLHTDYALRMLIHLGVNNGRLMTIGETANAYKISKNHMMKVAHRLCVEGYVISARGNGGGLRLAKHPAAINIGNVVRKIEGDFALVGCLQPCGQGCIITSACLLRPALQKALAAFFDVLDDYTLDDLLVTKPLLNELFIAGTRRKAPLQI
jgi:Rrf2 family transcriptional regulator, nitric oxide-sensitive transcriptional repressor